MAFTYRLNRFGLHTVLSEKLHPEEHGPRQPEAWEAPTGRSAGEVGLQRCENAPERVGCL